MQIARSDREMEKLRSEATRYVLSRVSILKHKGFKGNRYDVIRLVCDELANDVFHYPKQEKEEANANR